MFLRLPGHSPDRNSGFYRRGSVWGDTGVTTLGATNQIKHLTHGLNRGTVVVSHYKDVPRRSRLVNPYSAHVFGAPRAFERDSFSRKSLKRCYIIVATMVKVKVPTCHQFPKNEKRVKRRKRSVKSRGKRRQPLSFFRVHGNRITQRGSDEVGEWDCVL